MNKELRNFNIKTNKIEAREENGKKVVFGVIPYDSYSEDMGGWYEVIRKGAFTKSINESDIRCLWAHDSTYVCGRTKNDTFKLSDEDDGLHFECTLPNTTWAMDVFETIARRDAPGVSFGFYVVKDRWTEYDDKPTTRELLEVRLFEISIAVAFPAYSESNAEASTREIVKNAGIDFAKVEKIIAIRKVKKDYKVNDADCEEIRNIINVLTDLTASGEKSDAPKEESRENINQKPEESTYNVDSTISLFEKIANC